ncbi:type IV pilus assembly protein PilY1 [Actimicrobium sp. GrIS 1.19]|uniref:pilus assembly protein n=1 Tax=Actimicrobium sp. GrIS 1.19 TaxID=3071708 RepID=UPI002DF7FDF2|nr:type IV pilus assembly protein PilY1 [Actimicrobium sp. GrIS 1.19]
MTARPRSPATVRHTFQCVCLAVAGVFLGSSNAYAVVNLADQPLSTTASVPGNLLLALSVEFPTAISSSYKFSNTPYSDTSAYLGYFDPNKCYQYRYNTTTPGDSYFEPDSLTTTHTCTSTASKPLWSGNWLNWTSMQTIDTFRYALTGGYRVVDTANITILEKAWGSNQGSEGGNAPNKRLPTNGSAAAAVAGATPFTYDSVNSRIFSLGNKMYVSNGGVNGGGSVDYTAQNSYVAAGLPMEAKPSDVYALIMRVQVCKANPGVESNCTQYGANFKPEGLLQQYATKIRYGAVGYLNDDSINRDGGVLRAAMKFVGPLKPTPGQPNIANTATEWSSVDGTFLVNPDTADAAASNVANSGVLNYLNKFGQASHVYKTYDPIGEMYYAGIRYFKGQANVPEYSNLSADVNISNTWKDGFPVVTNWVDPILYSCQKNFILGIGDTNTHRDANLPGSTINGSEPTMPGLVSADTTVNVRTATDMVGTLEGIANLGTTHPAWCCNQNSFFVAGLAYDSHTHDMRPNDFKNNDGAKTNIQTVSTFWLDVQESGYQNNNQFYLATKYGGFKVPSGFQYDATTNAKNVLTVAAGTTPLTTAMWHNNADVYGANKRPDNYYDASVADKMILGLKGAFADIASQLTETTTAFATVSAVVNAVGSASYQTNYDAANWSGDVLGLTSVFDVSGNPTYTQVWSARNLLEVQPTRKIITCCTVSGGGLPFEVTNLSGGGLNARTNYGTFANVSGVPAGSQSASDYLAYLRGDRSKELNQPGGVYRTRTYLLGDIVDSKAKAVGPPEARFNESTNPGFNAYRVAYASRKPVVYVGANDGMLHAFDGSVPPASGGGAELFAYVPSFVYGSSASGPVSGLASLGTPSFIHHNLVDQTPVVYDIDLARTNGVTGTPNWRSILISGLGKGGNGYFAIDVTDPSQWTSESAMAANVKWEFTDPDMGSSFGAPNVFKTKKYGWVVIFTSGYNNPDGVGYIFIVNPDNGALLEKISTGFGTPATQSGLTQAAGYAQDLSDGTVDALYAGDLYGNVWRFDLSGTTSYPAPERIAELRSPSGVPQPVTTRPLVQIQPTTQKRYVLIGTGRLLDPSDVVNNQVQTFYAIGDGNVDKFYTASTLPAGVTFPIHRSDLNANTNLLLGIGAAPSNPLGWYFDLSLTSNGASERINVNPIANYGFLVFAANLPNGDACNPSGTNRVFGLNIGTGQSLLRVGGVGTAKIAYSTKFDGLVTDIGLLSTNGGTGQDTTALIGTNKGKTGQLDHEANGGAGILKLNWRELPTAD